MSENETKALQLCCRFSLPPNSLGYCGRNSAPEKFKKCVINGDCEGVAEEISKFIVLYPYLKTIGKIIDKPTFSYEVIESYWIGNKELKKAKASHYDLLLDNFEKQGVSKEFVKNLRSNKPKTFIPHHLFQVLYVGAGKVSGAAPFNLDVINNCMIRWGNVISIKDNSADVAIHLLKDKGGRLVLADGIEKFNFIPEFIPNLKAGDTVAVHWRQAVKKLTKEEEENLSYWTEKII